MGKRCEIVLPIRKVYSDRIFDGVKKYEYRRGLPSGVSRVYVYETCGSGKVVGEFEVERVMMGNLEILWNHTCWGSGVSEENFREYFEGCEIGYALVIGDVKRYEDGRDICEFGLSGVPQNYVFVNEERKEDEHV